MSQQGVEALRLERQEALDLAASLSDDEWRAESDCAGWRVADVYAHMGGVFHGVVDPSVFDLGDDPDPERGLDHMVDARRSWSRAEVLQEYEDYSAQAVEALAGMQEPPLAETMFPFGALGTYPMAIFANAFAFDHFCHLRNDVLAPHGPVDRPLLPADEVRLRPTVEWMMAGLPQMCPEVPLAAGPILLEFEGPGGGAWTVRAPGDDGLPVVIEEEGDDAVARIGSTVPEFVIWGTQRRPWRTREVSVAGDQSAAEAFLDALNII